MNNMRIILEAYNNTKNVNEAYGNDAKAKPLTKNQILDEIYKAEMLGVRTASITCISLPASSQSKSNPFYPIYKISRYSGKIGTDRELSINNALMKKFEKEGIEFKESDYYKQAASGWGVHLTKNIIEHPGKGTKYIQLNSGTETKAGYEKSIYVGKDKGKFRVLTDAEVAEHIVKKDRGSQVIITTRPLIDNVAGISINKEEFFNSELSAEQKEILKASGLR